MYGIKGIITYSEYLVATFQHSDIDRTSTDAEVEEFIKWAKEMDEATPSWFWPTQQRACALIRKCLAQSHLFPRNRFDYLDLKEDFWVEKETHKYHYEAMNFKELVRDAIAIETKFMKDNDVYFENGYINTTNPFQVGTFNMGGQLPATTHKLFNDIHPDAYNCFEQMGWTYASLEHRMDWDLFYKGEN